MLHQLTQLFLSLFAHLYTYMYIQSLFSNFEVFQYSAKMRVLLLVDTMFLILYLNYNENIH